LELKIFEQINAFISLDISILGNQLLLFFLLTGHGLVVDVILDLSLLRALLFLVTGGREKAPAK
jgi:hypothetical protein